MKTRLILFVTLIVISVILLSACGGGAATEAPANEDLSAPLPADPAAPAMEEPAMPESFAAPEAESLAPAQDQAKIDDGATIFEIAGESGENMVLQNTDRKIIKNADVRLLVKDTDVAHTERSTWHWHSSRRSLLTLPMTGSISSTSSPLAFTRQ
jgi:hypothetical protein